MNFDKKQLRNTMLLLLGALIWGTAFVAQSVGSGYVGPYTFLAARSWLACAFLIVLVLLRRGKARKADPGVPFWINGRMLLRGGVFCGIALFAASAAQQIGIGTTSTAKAGFLTALYVVLVPLLGVFFGRRPGVKLGICACISLAGLYLLCLAGHDTLTLARTYRHVVLSVHTPPHDTLCDIVGDGIHVGSSAVRDFILDAQPDVCLCGHIHESRAVDRLGRTVLVNPGAFATGGYAVLRLAGDDLSVTLHMLD